MCYDLLLGQTIIVRGNVSDVNGPLPFANITLINRSDNSIVCGTASGLNGEFSIIVDSLGLYSISASFVGYKNAIIDFDIKDYSEDIKPVDLFLEEDNDVLQEAVVSNTRASFALKKTSYTFSQEDIRASKDGRSLVSNIPNLYINAINNTLATIEGKSLLILVNGIKSSDYDLKLISPSEIAKVEYYDVPPMKYMGDAEVVINVTTRPISKGMSLDVDVVGGQLYSKADISVSFSKNQNKFSANIVGFMNPFRNVCDLEEGIYNYNINGHSYEYNYLEHIRDYGRQHAASFSWIRMKDNNYVLQISGKLSKNSTFTSSNSDIFLKKDGAEDKRIGAKSDSLSVMSPTINVYFSKQFNENSSLTMDAVFTHYGNEQKLFSSEIDDHSVPVFKDNMNLDTRKSSIIGEIEYEFSDDDHTIDIGYRGSFTHLSSNIDNSLYNNEISKINTSTQYLYGEYSSQIGKFMYGISLGGEFDIKESPHGFSRWAFTPLLLMGWNVGRNSVLRLNLSSSTTMPGIQQMTNNKIMLMEHLYASGNESLESYSTYTSNLNYIFHKGNDLNLGISLRYSVSPNIIYSSYIINDGAWNLQPQNANYFSELGPIFSVTYRPCTWFGLRMNASLFYQSFQEQVANETEHNWFFPINCMLQFSHKQFSMSYYQMFGGQSLNGLMLEGTEKVSYIKAAYNIGNFTLGAQLYFPFTNDIFSNSTTRNSKVYNNYSNNLLTKCRSIGITFSWNFIKGDDINASRSIINSDDDSGQFSYRRK